MHEWVLAYFFRAYVPQPTESMVDIDIVGRIIRCDDYYIQAMTGKGGIICRQCKQQYNLISDQFLRISEGDMESKVEGKKAGQTSSLRQWISLIAVYLFIPLVLFVCGGDFAWWQAYIYALLIVASGVGGRLFAERWHPGLMAERQSMDNIQGAKSWDKVLAPLMAVSVTFPPVIVAGLDHRFGWSPVFPLWLIVPGILLIAFGYAFSAWALAENRFFSSVVRIQSDRGHAVCDNGPYRMVRHPGYAGSVLSLPGIVLAFSSLWTIIPAFAALVIAVIRTAMEDRTLQEELPGYQEYARRVRYRLFPGIY